MPAERVFEALEVYLGSAYVNDFNLSRPHLPGHRPGRRRVPPGHARHRATSRRATTAGEMVPLGAVATFRDITGPYRVPRYNLYPAAEVQGRPCPGFSTGAGDRGDGADRDRDAAATASASSGPSSPARRSSPATTALLIFGASVRLRLPAAGGAVRELAAAAGGHPDRADVPAGGGHRRSCCAAWTSTSWRRSASSC